MKSYYTYLLTSRKRTVLYCGITNNLQRRLNEHRNGQSIFSGRYHVHHLVWFQEFSNPLDAIAMEKHIKKMSRAQKETLIRTINPAWNFIGEE